MSIQFNDNFQILANKPLDARFGPYADVTTALASVPMFQRYIGLILGVGTTSVSLYQFINGITDADLINTGNVVTSVNGQTGVVVITKTDVGLGNADNTSDANKPISIATQTALNGKQDSIGYTPENLANKGTDIDSNQTSNIKYPTIKAVFDWATGLFARLSDFNSHVTNFSNPHVVTAGQIGLGLVDNTTDLDKPVSDATQLALNGKQNTLVNTVNIRSVNGYSLVGSGNVEIPTGNDMAIVYAIALG